MTDAPDISVVLPTHNPQADRLRRTLEGLRGQTLASDRWECLLVDNASQPPLTTADGGPHAPGNFRIVPAPQLGLTHARRAGFAAARGELIVMVDDDNVLAPDYLARVAEHFAAHPKLGAAGGPVRGEFAAPKPAWWQPEFDGLLACRDLGPEVRITGDRPDPAHGRRAYPAAAPVGAGMALRRAALQAWLEDTAASTPSDRQGTALTSGGDNDIVLSLLRAGWSVGYFPDLALTHLIPAARLTRDYLARLNRGIAQSWVQVLARHDANPWPAVSRGSVPFRQLKAWFTYRAWSGPVAYIRWQGACGHFTGLAHLPSAPAAS